MKLFVSLQILSILLHKSLQMSSVEDNISDYKFKLNRLDSDIDTSIENGPIYIHQHRHHLKRHKPGSCPNCPKCGETHHHNTANNPLHNPGNIMYLPMNPVENNEPRMELRPGQYPSIARSEQHWPGQMSGQQWSANQESQQWAAQPGSQLSANSLVQLWPNQPWAVRSQQYQENQAQRLWQGNPEPAPQWPENQGIGSQWPGNSAVANSVQWPEGSWPGSGWPANEWPGSSNLNLDWAGSAARYFQFKRKSSTKGPKNTKGN